MAELKKEYRDLQKEIMASIEEFNINKEQNPEIPSLPEDFGTAIMYCLDKREGAIFEENWEDSRKLWDEQDHPMTEIPIGDHFIIVQDVVLDILKRMIKTGIMAFLIHNGIAAIPPEEASINYKDVVDVCRKLIASLNSLDTCDICLAYKVVKNPSTIYSSVDKDSIIKWFPVMEGEDSSPKCDMIDVGIHNSCEFFNPEDELCTVSKKGIDKAITSLEEKKIVKPVNNNTEYKFKW